MKIFNNERSDRLVMNAEFERTRKELVGSGLLQVTLREFSRRDKKRVQKIQSAETMIRSPLVPVQT
jgi:hypothetical protein